MLERLSKADVMAEYGLAQIIRYNNRRKLQSESVATHTCFVSIFCLKILSQLNVDKETERKVLIMAALHDTAESVISDIPHNVKKLYPQVKQAAEAAERNYFNKTWGRYEQELRCMYEHDDDPLAYHIFLLADTYSVYQYTLSEHELGNTSEDNMEIMHSALGRIDHQIECINKIMEGR